MPKPLESLADLPCYGPPLGGSPAKPRTKRTKLSDSQKRKPRLGYYDVEQEPPWVECVDCDGSPNCEKCQDLFDKLAIRKVRVV